MKLTIISNLYPRPDQPARGLFNFQLFAALAEGASNECRVVCLVPEWRVWKWGDIRSWQADSIHDTMPSAGDVRGASYPILHPSSLPALYLPVFYLPLIGRDWSWMAHLAALKRVRHLTTGCDALFATWLYPDGVAVVEFAAANGIPVWIMAQGSDTFHLDHAARRRAILAACNKAGGVICVCRSLAERLISAGVDSRKVHVVPNGVDSAMFRCRPKKEAWKELAESRGEARFEFPVSAFTGRDTRIVLFVGNLVHVKGPDILLRAFAELVQGSKLRVQNSNFQSRISNFQLIVIGDGPMRKKLERLCSRLGIADSAYFLGCCPHKEIPLWMNVADCLCLSSRSEGMPNVVLEALASGLPVVASDVGACRDLLEAEPAARLVSLDKKRNGGSCADAASLLSKALGELLAEPVDRSEFAARHGKRGWSDQARQILDLMRGKSFEATSRGRKEFRLGGLVHK